MRNQLSIAFQSLFKNYHGLKLSSLYFDEIIVSDDWIGVINGTGRSDSPYYDTPDCMATAMGASYDFSINSFPKVVKSETKILQDEGILKIENIRLASKDKEFLQKFIYDAKAMLDNPENDYSIYKDEIDLALTSNCKVWEPYKTGGKLHSKGEFGMAVGFFSCLGLNSTLEKEISFCSDSNAIFQVYSEFLDSHQEKKQELKKNYLAYRVLQLSLPDLENSSFEEILEARFKLKDELIGFRYEVNNLSWELKENDSSEIKQEIDKIIDTKVNPSLQDLKNKIKHSREKLIQKIFSTIKNPKSYVPLIGGLYTGLPIEIAIGSSIVLSGMENINSMRTEKKQIKRANNFSYLFDLKKKLK